MARQIQGLATKGSQKWLQRLVNDEPDALNRDIAGAIGLGRPDDVIWLSPLRDDEYAEYSDDEFLRLLGARLDRRPLRDFWPTRGPVWDGLARTKRGDLLLVEAKAHIPEVVSPPTGAGEASFKLISRSLEETRTFLNASTHHPWTGTFYQYLNRLAHLYLLRELNGLPAWVLHVCFVGAEDVHGPGTVEEWRGALRLLDAFLGLGRHRLSPFVVHLFIDVRLSSGGRCSRLNPSPSARDDAPDAPRPGGSA